MLVKGGGSIFYEILNKIEAGWLWAGETHKNHINLFRILT